MVTTNNERVGKALELLRAGLGPFVEAHSRSEQFRGSKPWQANTSVTQWDAYKLLDSMKGNWYHIFSNVLGPTDKNLVHELLEQRNNWAHPTHQNSFSIDDAYRVLDSTARLLTAVKAPQAAEAENMKAELGRLIYAQPMRSEKNKAEDKDYSCPISGCQKVFNGSRGGWDAHVASPKKHPEWHPEIDDPRDRKARFKTEFSSWFTRD